MEILLAAYNVKVDSLSAFYHDLNKEIEYERGKTTSLGIVFWGKGELLDDLPEACAKITRMGINDIIQLSKAIGTPARMKKFMIVSGVEKKLLRILAHDIQMWLPQPVSLSDIPILREKTDDIGKLHALGINNQVEFLSRCQKKNDRMDISKIAGIDMGTIDEDIRICDYFRMGGKMDAIRPVLYYKMGQDTFKKWAGSKPQDIIDRFQAYLKTNALEGQYLVPFPKELANGIAWAKVHAGLFEVEY